MGDDIKDFSDKEVGEFIKRSADLCSVLLDLALDDIVKAASAHDQFSHEQNSNHLRSGERPIASR